VRGCKYATRDETTRSKNRGMKKVKYTQIIHEEDKRVKNHDASDPPSPPSPPPGPAGKSGGAVGGGDGDGRRTPLISI
jgi:hypothetical protein